MKRFSIHFAVLAFAAVTVLGSTAFAIDETDTFVVSATVVASCSIAAGDLAFGAYDPTEGANVPGTSTISITCSSGTPWAVGLDDGGSSVLFANREMNTATPDTKLLYNLFTELEHTNVWNLTTVRSSSTGTGINQDITVYGLILAGQNTVKPGAYTDTIVATITY